MAQQLVPDLLLQRVARRFKILGEPVRLRLLNQLQMHGEMCVQDLIAATGEQQATVSKHLGYLFREGVVSRRKAGQKVYYRLDDPSIAAVCLLLCARLREQMDGTVPISMEK